ncbi:MAG: DUF6754 domain-containing protein [Chloroflexota bacterium]
MDSFQELFTNITQNPALLTFSIILLAFIINAVARVTERKPMRPLSAMDALPVMTGTSVESSRPLHISVGSASLGDDSTVLTLLSNEFLYYITRQVAVGDTPPLFTMSDSATLPIATDTLRRAYTYESRLSALNSYNPLSKQLLSLRWYPAGQRSLAFAAALTTLQQDDEVTGNILVGRHGIEIALVLDAAYRNGRPSIATSEQLDGQAIAFGMSDHSLIGEEIFTASAYLHSGTRLQRRNLAIDLLRGIVVATILGLFVFNLFQGG